MQRFVPLKHKKYFARFLKTLPANLNSFDTNRVTLAYFCISGLDVLNGLDILLDEDKTKIINWIYSLQVINTEDDTSGFQGSSTFNTNPEYKIGHVAATYCALCCLLILGDDLSRVNRKEICKSLKSIQLEDGCCSAAKYGTENDMRFLFCAAATSYILDDFSGINIDKATEFILSSISYDYGIAQGPDLESHGGSTYCALATLALTTRLSSLTPTQQLNIHRWLAFRQLDGFQGRPNKPADSCYTFWVGAGLHILGASVGDISEKALRTFVMMTEGSATGGFSKWINYPPDPLHSYLALAGMSLLEIGRDEFGLKEVVPMLNVTKRVVDHLHKLHEKWRLH